MLITLVPLNASLAWFLISSACEGLEPSFYIPTITFLSTCLNQDKMLVKSLFSSHKPLHHPQH